MQDKEPKHKQHMLHSIKDACSQVDNILIKHNSVNKISRNQYGYTTPQRWYEYFRGLFSYANLCNRYVFIQHESECNIFTSDAVIRIDGDILNRDISLTEITDVINHLPKSKSQDVDGIL